MIQVGEKIPDATLRRLTADGPQEVSAAEFFAGRKVVLFAVVGAFTGTCNNQLPTFASNADAMKAKGVDEIACVAVNDVFVLDAWAKSSGTGDTVTMLADGNAEFAGKIGAALDASAHGLGTRTRRYSMLVEDGEVKALHVEDNPGVCTVTSGDEILNAL